MATTMSGTAGARGADGGAPVRSTPRVRGADDTTGEPSAALAVGVDIGGTKIATGVVTAGGTIVATTQRPTPAQDPDAIERTIADCVAELRREHPATAVGLAAAGYASSDRSTMLFAPNLAWRDRSLGSRVAALTGLDVVVENDANAAAWAEHRFGAGRGHDHVLTVTLGTGVGGGIVVDGRLLRGHRGYAAEIGHVRAVRGGEGRLCGCGNRGCWEPYLNGPALAADARRRAREDPAWAAGLLERAGGSPEAITGPMVTEAAQAGDPGAADVLADYGSLVGEFCASLVAVLDPGVVVVGGGVSHAGDLVLGPARETFEASLSPRGHRPPVELRGAVLGNAAGIVGAADLART